MSSLLGTVISAQVTTGDTANTFSIGDTNLMQGGHHTVTYLEERDAITTERRREGMTCWVAGTVSTLYRLTGGTNNVNWQEVISSGGGGASAAASGYFLDPAASGTLAYNTLAPVLSGSSEVVVPVTVSSGSLEPIGSFIGPQINRSGIDAGIWQFINYAKVADAGNPSQVVVEVYTRSVAGAETFLFSGTSDAVSRSSVASYSIFASQGSFTAPVPTDKLVAKYYGRRTSAPASVLSFYYSGTVNASLFTTPIGNTHNALKGLQGGQTDQYYHATEDQHAALAGSQGAPGAANRYVTEQGLATEVANRTNADAGLQTQINDIGSIVGAGFYGTVSMYLAQFRNGPPDTRLAIVNGVVTGQEESVIIWEDFENYPTGTLPPITKGSGWAGQGTITTQPGYGVQAEDNQETYAVGGTVGVTVFLTGGTGWGSNGTVVVPWIALVGTELFETYTVGTITTPGTLTDGWGFSAAPAIYAY